MLGSAIFPYFSDRTLPQKEKEIEAIKAKNYKILKITYKPLTKIDYNS